MRLASINMENRTRGRKKKTRGVCFDILDSVVRHRADDVKRIYGLFVHKTNCYLEETITILIHILEQIPAKRGKKQSPATPRQRFIINPASRNWSLTYWPLPQPPSGTR